MADDMKIYAVIDTNVIVSALITKRQDSSTRLILDYLFTGTIIPILNQEILDEYEEVLGRSKFKLSPKKIDVVLQGLKSAGIFLDRVNSYTELPDPKDLVFYEVTLAKDDSYLVTGNIKHFPKEKFVVTPAEMLEIIEAVS